MLDVGDYTVGWVCALPAENLAAQEFLHEEHEGPEWRSKGDTNSYRLGRIGKHNTVIAVLPLGEYGTASAAVVATNMVRSFPNISIGLMVGIGGGAPRLPHRDVRLGDVVVSYQENGHGGVFQYDFGKSIQERSFEYTQPLHQPPQALLTAIAGLRKRHNETGNGLLKAVNQVLEKNPTIKDRFGRPSSDTDILFESDFVHAGGSCASCYSQGSDRVIPRPEREPGLNDGLVIHYGTIASGNTLMKDALLRDRLADEKNLLCFEMEAAGLMNTFPCVAIRGFAALAAAAYARDLVNYLVPERVQEEKKLTYLRWFEFERIKEKV
ncbi:hypothetical protein F66182_9927 [Fusarium sp. NRRL 66182]|nr:hypothetical protein F66182_9927 [Fusarium sp. NRRL 66182]